MITIYLNFDTLFSPLVNGCLRASVNTNVKAQENNYKDNYNDNYIRVHTNGR